MLYDLPAPAKINLFLHITGRRADGYHLLQTVFRFIGLSDTLHIDMRADGRITREYDLPGVSEENDLCLRAARALRQATGTRRGAHIALTKRIPSGGGLGGGSSDAATVLIALNRLWATHLDRPALMALALDLGADVPVFVFGQSAFAEGIGETLAAVLLPDAAYLVMQPDASVPTAEIFTDPELTRDTSLVKIADFLTQPTAAFGRNDLEPVAMKRYAEVRRALDWLAVQGVQARMSGSGACLFSEYADMAQATLVQENLAGTIYGLNRVTGSGLQVPIDGSRQVQAVSFRLMQACPGLIEHPLRHWIAT